MVSVSAECALVWVPAQITGSLSPARGKQSSSIRSLVPHCLRMELSGYLNKSHSPPTSQSYLVHPLPLGFGHTLERKQTGPPEVGLGSQSSGIYSSICVTNTYSKWLLHARPWANEKTGLPAHRKCMVGEHSRCSLKAYYLK